jgi:hypothetical protein
VKPAILLPLLLFAGLGVGGGTAFGVHQVLPSKNAAAPARAKTDTGFVPTGKILAPLVSPDGRLSGYVSFEVQLEAEEADIEFVTARLPLLFDAINMRTYRTPMTSGPQGMLPELRVFRKLVLESADEAFGKHVVRRAVIMQATPA